MLLPRPKQARNMICAPRRAQKAASSTDAADTRTLRQRYFYYKTADGCKGGWAYAQHAPAGRTANGVAVSQPIQWSSEYHDTELALIYYKTPDGCKGGWTCAQRAPRRGETTRGVVESTTATIIRKTADGQEGIRLGLKAG